MLGNFTNKWFKVAYPESQRGLCPDRSMIDIMFSLHTRSDGVLFDLKVKTKVQEILIRDMFEDADVTTHKLQELQTMINLLHQAPKDFKLTSL